MKKTIEDVVRKSGGVWPKRLLSKGSIGVMLWLDSDGGITVCTRTEFEECARRLRNEPSFADHPDAKCFVQDDDGRWYKNTETNNVRPRQRGWVCSEGYFRPVWDYVQKGEVIGDWKQTLRLRSEEKKMEDKNDWYKKGEFPPVGTVCKLRFATNAEIVVTITYVGDGVLCYRDEKGMEYAVASNDVEFHPLQTERERWVEKAYDIYVKEAPTHSETWTDVLKRIYDAGLAKMPEDKQ